MTIILKIGQAFSETGTLFRTLHSLRNLLIGPISQCVTLHWHERLARTKHCSLLGPIVRNKENEVLWHPELPMTVEANVPWPPCVTQHRDQKISKDIQIVVYS